MPKETVQTGLRFPEELLNKIKYIANKDRRSINNTVIIGMEEYVSDWEAQNEAITTAQVKKAKK